MISTFGEYIKQQHPEIHIRKIEKKQMKDRPIPLPLSGSILKVIAVSTMLIDHVAAYLLTAIPVCSDVWLHILGEPVSWVWVMRMTGRLSFPLFVFLLVEGYRHTRDRDRYGLLLLLFALLSELPFDLAGCGHPEFTTQNIFFTLLLGYAGMRLWDYWRADPFNRLAGMLMLGCAAVISRCDYGLAGFLFIMVMYAWHTHPVIKVGATAWLLSGSLFVFLSSFPMTCYDGTRGFIRTPRAKYAFYAFYPLHLLIIYLIKQMI